MELSNMVDPSTPRNRNAGGTGNRNMLPYRGTQSMPIEVIDISSSSPPSQADTNESPARRPPHSNFKAIKIHTAKCDVCNKHNKSTLQRCIDCGWQICSPCWGMRGGNGSHGVTRTFTGPVFCSSDEEELPRKKPARGTEKSTPARNKAQFPKARPSREKDDEYEDKDEDDKDRSAARNPNNTIVAGGKVHKKRRFRDLSPEAENRMNMLLIAAEEVLKDSDAESGSGSEFELEQRYESAKSPLFVPTPTGQPMPSRAVNTANPDPANFSAHDMQYPPRAVNHTFVPITRKFLNSLPTNTTPRGRQQPITRQNPSSWQAPLPSRPNLVEISGDSTEDEKSPPSRPFRGRTWEL